MIFMFFINLHRKGLQEPGGVPWLPGAEARGPWGLIYHKTLSLFGLMLYNARFLFYYFFGHFFHEFEPLGIWFFSFLMIFMFFMILVFAKPMPCFGAAACFSKPGGSTEASPCEKHGNMEKWAHGRISGLIVQIMNFIFLIFIQKCFYSKSLFLYKSYKNLRKNL